jgi:hypothetical protein
VHGANPVTLITNFREQKRLEQTLRRGRRLSIVGLLQPEISFVYGLVIGGVDRKAYTADSRFMKYSSSSL